MVEMSVLEVVVCLSEVIDLMCEEIKDHHKRVANIAYCLAKEMGYEKEALRDIVVAAALHDIGGLSMEARRCAVLHFEDTNSHAERGYRLLSIFEPLAKSAHHIRYHHTNWNYGKGPEPDNQPPPQESQILLMSDRIGVTLTPGIHTLNQAHAITREVLAKEGEVYNPQLIEAFQRLSGRAVFWLDVMTPDFYDTIMAELKAYDIWLSAPYVDEMLDLLSNLVDFRSVFTTVHSKGVAAVAQQLARLMDFSEENCYKIKVAALMHDLGKLAIPSEIIEKPGPLSQYERDIIRTHSYYTDRVISRLSGFDQVRVWASSHHENLNGTGYPFCLDSNNLSCGSKIMKVADVFVALTEDRPYRDGMAGTIALEILDQMVCDGEVDAGIVNILATNLDSINQLREQAESKAALEYEKFISY